MHTTALVSPADLISARYTVSGEPITHISRETNGPEVAQVLLDATPFTALAESMFLLSTATGWSARNPIVPRHAMLSPVPSFGNACSWAAPSVLLGLSGEVDKRY